MSGSDDHCQKKIVPISNRRIRPNLKAGAVTPTGRNHGTLEIILLMMIQKIHFGKNENKMDSFHEWHGNNRSRCTKNRLHFLVQNIKFV
ncbi:hypothetical protein ACM44_08360 [Chryseobacterium koreense CCUG 49689]|uniref:Uncharacterized protein n=1 Tax=Chryseobacterium koreense CCUG 49689 TaxID=1304281 RepID=A0A0J7IZD5_9FLAO|nr:hypothetical protein ACM44_08360 [Chryseobacterium koreense CCUG 49689]